MNAYALAHPRVSLTYVTHRDDVQPFYRARCRRTLSKRSKFPILDSKHLERALVSQLQAISYTDRISAISEGKLDSARRQPETGAADPNGTLSAGIVTIRSNARYKALCTLRCS